MKKSDSRLTTKDRFLPCLIDRLTDDEPHVKNEEKNVYKVFSIQQLRKAILRDVINLLNSKSKIPAQDLQAFEEISSSVLNYGLEDICGKSYYSTSLQELEESIRTAVIKFEPRINKENLQVKVIQANKDKTYSSFAVEIHGMVNVYPLTEELLIRSEVDLETGNFINTN